MFKDKQATKETIDGCLTYSLGRDWPMGLQSQKLLVESSRGSNSTEVAFAILTQQPQVQFPAFP